MSVFNKPADTTPVSAEPQSEPALKRWACSYIDWYDNELTTKIVMAANWLDAFKLAYPTRYANITSSDESAPETLDQAKTNAFNCDSMVNVVEVPNE